MAAGVAGVAVASVDSRSQRRHDRWVDCETYRSSTSSGWWCQLLESMWAAAKVVFKEPTSLDLTTTAFWALHPIATYLVPIPHEKIYASLWSGRAFSRSFGSTMRGAANAPRWTTPGLVPLSTSYASVFFVLLRLPSSS